MIMTVTERLNELY